MTDRQRLKKADVLKYFKTNGNVAKALKISPSAITMWGEYVPELSAFELQYITNGELKHKPGRFIEIDLRRVEAIRKKVLLEEEIKG